MTNSVFLTGTESFVGREFVAHCDDLGYELSGCDAAEPLRAGFKQHDIRANDIADIIPEGVDAIVHLAALSTDASCRNRAYECFDVNVMGTLNLMRAAQQRHAKQFVFASSEWVYDSFPEEPRTEDSPIDIAKLTSEYALSKIVNEANLRQKFQHGFCDTTILRFGIIYGTRTTNWSAVESIFNTMKHEDEVTVGSLRTGRFFIHVTDIARGIAKAIGLAGFNIVNLQGRELVTLSDLVRTSERVLDKRVKVSESAPDDVSVRRVSTERAKSLLKWQATVELEDGLRALNEIL